MYFFLVMESYFFKLNLFKIVNLMLLDYINYLELMYILIGVVRGVDARKLGKGLELLRANGGIFAINHLLFTDDTALVADSEEKLC